MVLCKYGRKGSRISYKTQVYRFVSDFICAGFSIPEHEKAHADGLEIGQLDRK